MGYEKSKEKAIYNLFDLSDYTIDNFKTITNDEDFTGKISVDATLNTIGSVTGNRISVKLNTVSGTPCNPRRERNRKTDFLLEHQKMYNDTIVIKLPQGYVLESGEPVYELKGNFGEFCAKFEHVDNKYYYIRKLVTKKGTFNPGQYEEFYDFYRNTDRFEAQNLTFMKN